MLLTIAGADGDAIERTREVAGVIRVSDVSERETAEKNHPINEQGLQLGNKSPCVGLVVEDADHVAGGGLIIRDQLAPGIQLPSWGAGGLQGCRDTNVEPFQVLSGHDLPRDNPGLVRLGADRVSTAETSCNH